MIIHDVMCPECGATGEVETVAGGLVSDLKCDCGGILEKLYLSAPNTTACMRPSQGKGPTHKQVLGLGKTERLHYSHTCKSQAEIDKFRAMCPGVEISDKKFLSDGSYNWKEYGVPKTRNYAEKKKLMRAFNLRERGKKPG